MNSNYLVIGKHSWNKEIFDKVISKYEGRWKYTNKIEYSVTSQYDRNKTLNFYDYDIDDWRSIDPRYIFFLHYSKKVPLSILNRYECVCFHSTDVPYGRGGSPIQNLIIRGHKETKLTALKMVKEFDAGPVFLKKDLCLEGSAEEIFIRQSKIAAEMILEIIENKIEPQDQVGEPFNFKRRKPEESEIKEIQNLDQLYDFIRMLDAEGYPKAFLKLENYKLEFSRVSKYCKRLKCDVEITENGN